MKRRIGGYNDYCLQMDSLKQMVNHYKVINNKLLVGIYKAIKEQLQVLSETQKVRAELQQDACALGVDLLQILKLKQIDTRTFDKYYECKEYIYRIFFKPDFEPIVRDFENRD